MQTYLEFEKPIAELETRVAELRETASAGELDLDAEIGKLQAKAAKLLQDTYAKLTPWQKAQVARHPERPHFKDYVAGMADDFVPLAGDRSFADDPAIIGGLATIGGRKVLLIGHEKGDDTASRLKHNFGMAKPEGYRKAIRLMQLADRFGLPVVSLVDTPGAFPGVQAEERGQAEAIARSTEECLKLKVPLIAVVVGEGGSGGAVAIATAPPEPPSPTMTEIIGTFRARHCSVERAMASACPRSSASGNAPGVSTSETTGMPNWSAICIRRMALR